MPRTRRYSPLEVVRASARRAGHIDRMILACVVLGLSTRKVAAALLPVLGRRISAGTVSTVAKTLDAAGASCPRRPLKDQYPVLRLDGVVLARKTGAGALRRPVLVALGLRADGRKEIIDYREVRRRTRPRGIFQDRTAMDRILFAVFTHENANQGVPTLFSLTHTC